MYVIYDLETTGFTARDCDCVQFAYIMLDHDFKFVKSETLYFYYEGMSYNQRAFEVHGKSPKFLKQYEADFEKNLVKMFTVLNRAHTVGFNNISFDDPFATGWLNRMGLPLLEFSGQSDVMIGFKPFTKQPRIKLTKLLDLMGFGKDVIDSYADMWYGDTQQFHDASYDVTATALLFLVGNAKGYFGLNPVVKAIHDTPKESNASEEEDLLSNVAPYVPEAILFNLFEEDGTDRRAVFNKGNTTPVDIKLYDGKSNQVFPYVFNKVKGTTQYKASGGDCTFYIKVTGNVVTELTTAYE